MVSVKLLREIAEHRIVGVCRHPPDYQLVSRHTQCQEVTAGEQRHEPIDHLPRCRLERRVTVGIQPVFVEGDREFNEEIR